MFLDTLLALIGCALLYLKVKGDRYMDWCPWWVILMPFFAAIYTLWSFVGIAGWLAYIGHRLLQSRKAGSFDV